MDPMERQPGSVRWTLRLEEAAALDAAVAAVEPTIQSVFGTGAKAAVLRGDWLGHTIHPLLTDLVLGSWTSATLLDLFGGTKSSAAAQQLIGAGLLAVGPTAWTGWAEWSAAGERDKRVGLVHAISNAVAISLYGASYLARRRDRRSSPGLGSHSRVQPSPDLAATWAPTSPWPARWAAGTPLTVRHRLSCDTDNDDLAGHPNTSGEWRRRDAWVMAKRPSNEWSKRLMILV